MTPVIYLEVFQLKRKRWNLYEAWLSPAQSNAKKIRLYNTFKTLRVLNVIGERYIGGETFTLVELIYEN